MQGCLSMFGVKFLFGLHAEAVSALREGACEEVFVLCLNDRKHKVSMNVYKIVEGGVLFPTKNMNNAFEACSSIVHLWRRVLPGKVILIARCGTRGWLAGSTCRCASTRCRHWLCLAAPAANTQVV